MKFKLTEMETSQDEFCDWIVDWYEMKNSLSKPTGKETSQESFFSRIIEWFKYKDGLEYLEEKKTHFRTAYMCLKCFDSLRKEKLKIYSPRTDNIILDNIDLTFDNISDRNKIKVLIADFNKDSFKYYFLFDDVIWRERREKEYNDNIRYAFLFTKDYDSINDTYYTFRGLYRLHNSYFDIIIWKKCSISKDNNLFINKGSKISIKKEDIEKYIKIEEDLAEKQMKK